MPFICQTQPLCRTCGKPIAKYTHTHTFGAYTGGVSTEWSTAHKGVEPKSKEEVGRIVNQQIVSVRWHKNYQTGERLYIDNVTTWDGESYRDEFFCKNDCAVVLGYAAARHRGLVMEPYNTALAERKGN